MSTSTVPAAVSYLIAQLQATSVVTNPISGFAIAVYRGAPLMSAPVDEAFVIQSASRTTQRFEMVVGGGTGYLREDFTIPLEIVVFRGGDDVGTVEARAWALLSAAESMIRADLTLGGTVLEAWPESSSMVSEWALNEEDLPIGRRASITCNVMCWQVI
jgi:hypothetical protein